MNLAVIDVAVAGVIAWGVAKIFPIEGERKVAIFAVLFFVLWLTVSATLNTRAWW